MYGSRPFYRAVHLDNDHWNNIPESASLNYFYNNSANDKNKRDTVQNIVFPVLKEILTEILTKCQLNVVNLCLINQQLTQTAAAKILGIAQSTVSQHLNGKRRNGKKIGGAHRRVQKKFRQISVQNNLSMHENKVFELLEAIFDPKTSRRKREHILETLV